MLVNSGLRRYQADPRLWDEWQALPIINIRNCWQDGGGQNLSVDGIYDIGDNTGWVTVGVDADAAEFAVESIRQWWRWMGKRRYPKAKGLLICADSSGSNGYRSHLRKCELQGLAWASFIGLSNYCESDCLYNHEEGPHS
jgi:hypothetical protein